MKDLQLMPEQVVESYPIEMINQIMEWQNETTSDVVYSVLDTVIDIIIDNTVWED